MAICIGFDARPLTQKLTGTGVILSEVLKNLEIANDKNYKIYLFSDKEIQYEGKEKFTCIESSSFKGPFWFNLVLPQLLRKHDISIFIGTMQYLPLFNLNGCKMFIILNDLVPFKAFNTMKWTAKTYNVFQFYHSLRVAKSIMCISNTTCNDLLDYYTKKKIDISDKKICVGLCGVRQEMIAPSNGVSYHLPAELNLVAENYYLCISTVEPRKNYIKLIEQYKKSGSDKKLVIVGKLGWYYKNFVEEVKNNPQIIYLEYASKELLTALIKNCYCYLNPSIYEGFGLPLLEVLSYDKPVICNNILVFQEIRDLIPKANIQCVPLNNFFSTQPIYPEANIQEEIAKVFSFKKQTQILSDLITDHQQ